MSYNSDARIQRLYEKFAEFKTKRDAYINSKNIYNSNVKKLPIYYLIGCLVEGRMFHVCSFPRITAKRKSKYAKRML